LFLSAQRKSQSSTAVLRRVWDFLIGFDLV
jgi:hypothetical protein